jgi:hypothetical protein
LPRPKIRLIYVVSSSVGVSVTLYAKPHVSPVHDHRVITIERVFHALKKAFERRAGAFVQFGPFAFERVTLGGCHINHKINFPARLPCLAVQRLNCSFPPLGFLRLLSAALRSARLFRGSAGGLVLKPFKQTPTPPLTVFSIARPNLSRRAIPRRNQQGSGWLNHCQWLGCILLSIKCKSLSLGCAVSNRFTRS